MLAGYNKLDVAKLFAPVIKVVLLVNALVGAYILGAVVAVFAEAEGDFLYIYILDAVEGVFVVAVKHQKTRGLLCKLIK